MPCPSHLHHRKPIIHPSPRTKAGTGGIATMSSPSGCSTTAAEHMEIMRTWAGFVNDAHSSLFSTPACLQRSSRLRRRSHNRHGIQRLVRRLKRGQEGLSGTMSAMPAEAMRPLGGPSSLPLHVFVRRCTCVGRGENESICDRGTHNPLAGEEPGKGGNERSYPALRRHHPSGTQE